MLKKLLTICLILISQLGISQFVDDFSDGDFMANPIWSGDDGMFIIGGNELVSQSALGGNYYLSTPSTLATNGQWDFYFNMKFGTSGVNYVDVYLISDVADLTAPNNGYFLRLGGTSDEVSLYKMVSGTSAILIDGPDNSINSSSNNPFNVRVTRDLFSNWVLSYDDGLTGNLVSIGSISDNTVLNSSFFGIAITQSGAAGPRNSHYFDNFSIHSIIGDTASPLIDSVVVLNAKALDVYFNEPVGLVASQIITNYSIDFGIGKPSSVLRDLVDSSLVHLTFKDTLTNGELYNLTVTNVDDTLGNNTTGIVMPFAYLKIIAPNFGDVVINEVYADPTPQVGLPLEEFVELYNVSKNVLVLNNWKFINTTISKTLPHFILKPNSYVILCELKDTALYKAYGDVIGIPSFTALTNGKDSLTLTDNLSNVLDIVNYDISWYQDEVKDDGGWSLERINPVQPCNKGLNWIASSNLNGGTPGQQNSVFDSLPDVKAPIISFMQVVSPSQLRVLFNEMMDSLSLIKATYNISGDIVVSLVEVRADNFEVFLTVNPALSLSTNYELTVVGASDCSGNTMANENVVPFVIPEQAVFGDLIINEVLFNPYFGGVDFVEIYNNSNKVIDMLNWSLANLEKDSIDNHKTITDSSKIILPGEFMILTIDAQNVVDEYINAARNVFMQMKSFPSYRNDKGEVYLINNLYQTIDSLHYNENMHFALLTNFEGVSLERINYNRPSKDKGNWHSAAENDGFATPGYENSQYMKSNIDNDEVVLDPLIFSPDNDGRDDVVNISYNFVTPGFVATIVIYDSKGRLVRKLAQSKLLGISGTFSWDGINDKSEKASIGVYIVFIEAFDLEGNVKAFKKAVVLAGNL